MKISELTEDQLCVIAESKPGWMADNRPNCRAYSDDIPVHIMALIRDLKK